MKKVLITGGSGLVGRELSALLMEKGYRVSWLSRRSMKNGDVRHFQWDVEKGAMDEKALDEVDCIIHLAGEGIGSGRWTPARKRRILDSRVESARLLFDQVSKTTRKPEAFISSSAIGYYGAVTSERIFEENDLPQADDFLSRTCQAWENSAKRFSELGIRQVSIRAGVVLSGKKGALNKLRLPVSLGLGAPLGKGNQYIPWIHLQDLCRIYLQAIEDPNMSGPFNAVAPEHVTNRQLTGNMARVMGKPFWLPGVPGVLVRLLLGPMSEMLLCGSRVSADRIISTGFEFRYPSLEPALDNCLGESNSET